MRRPGTDHTRETFSEVAGHGDITIRPARSAKTKRPPPFSIRFTDDEKARLLAAAGNLTLAAYIKARLFADLPAVPRQRSPSPCDRKMMSQALALLGQSRLSANMNQIARAANLGVLPLDPELIADLNAACSDIHFMRETLLAALGRKASSP